MSAAETRSPELLAPPARYLLPILIGGYVTELLAAGLSFVEADAIVPVRVILLLAGLIAAGLAVMWRLQAGDESEGTQGAAAFVLLSAGVPLVASFGMDNEWDTAQLVCYVLMAVAIAGGVLLLVPRSIRRLAASLMVLFHFGAICIATTAIPALGQPPPWWNTQLWSTVYRNYFAFLYVGNAYHFYSPDPGPPTLLWFRVEYANSTARWVKVPLAESFATRLEFQRRLGLSEFALHPTQPWPAALQVALMKRKLPELYGNALCKRIPFDETFGTPDMQYRKPAADSQVMLAGYARHVARTYPCEDDPSSPVVSVKVYMLTHTMLGAKEYKENEDPLDPARYKAWFEGEYDKDGNLQPDDGLRYWYLPIVWMPYAERENFPIIGEPIIKVTEKNGVKQKWILVDYVKIHSGDRN